MNNSVNKQTTLIRKNGFYTKYLAVCKDKNTAPLCAIKRNEQKILDLIGDRIGTNNWLAIIDAIENDATLTMISINLRKHPVELCDEVDSILKLYKFKTKIPLLSKIIFGNLIRSISNCLSINTSLTTLNLNGLPLSTKYMQFLVEGISKNISLRYISLERCALLDEGCELICNTVKYLPNIELLNFSQCDLSDNSAIPLSELIKSQSIHRYTEGWKHSLRYREIDPNNISGLKRLILNKNPQIGSETVRKLVDALKDDDWVKIIEMQHCGVSDPDADLIIALLKQNKSILIFDVKHNEALSKHRSDQIKQMLGCDSNTINESGSTLPLSNKTIIDNQKEELTFVRLQLNTETTNRKRSEELTNQLQSKLVEYEKKIEENTFKTPEGHTLIETNKLNNLLNESKQLKLLQSQTFIKDKRRKKYRSTTNSQKCNNQIGELSQKPKSLYSIQTRAQAVGSSIESLIDREYANIGDGHRMNSIIKNSSSNKNAMNAQAVFFGTSPSLSAESE